MRLERGGLPPLPPQLFDEPRARSPVEEPPAQRARTSSGMKVWSSWVTMYWRLKRMARFMRMPGTWRANEPCLRKNRRRQRGAC